MPTEIHYNVPQLFYSAIRHLFMYIEKDQIPTLSPLGNIYSTFEQFQGLIWLTTWPAKLNT
jgi:hypothetical protein